RRHRRSSRDWSSDVCSSDLPISVTTPAGTGTSTSNFTVTPATAPPTITSFTPTSGPVGTVVTITGNNFSGATKVAFNGTAASFTDRKSVVWDHTCNQRRRAR